MHNAHSTSNSETDMKVTILEKVYAQCTWLSHFSRTQCSEAVSFHFKFTLKVLLADDFPQKNAWVYCYTTMNISHNRILILKPKPVQIAC